MTSISIIGAGNMGTAIAGIAATGGASVQLLAQDAEKTAAAAAALGASVVAGVAGDALTGDIVILALPYPAVAGVLAQYRGQLDGKIVVDITNPLDFATFDSLVVPSDGSAAQVIAEAVPGARVLKAFNTTFAATLATGGVNGVAPTTVLVAGDDASAKDALISVLVAGGVLAVDAGALKRARELEALGFLQLTLAAAGTTGWTGGFALVK
ncbi:NADPH-dependent F420 reductase [Cryobacterium sp.]|jgi:predicted dinucleotide-binding enzyme|uniref:NADPH-dependent F420 reductase n=1 Tax=Cryobacterium sp. TaxID=1926290 RepID=UPI002637F7C1|nr:NADPH-dependent F420 reductase [Cryobacterium sp.]MCU1445089.1 diguanylate cyclase [Cryobacterium sp.]